KKVNCCLWADTPALAFLSIWLIYFHIKVKVKVISIAPLTCSPLRAPNRLFHFNIYLFFFALTFLQQLIKHSICYTVFTLNIRTLSFSKVMNTSIPRIAQATAALTKLKPIWRDKNISLGSKVKRLSFPHFCMPVNHGP
ncbi:MAG: hypothetical protein AB2801_20310, partial [Candidatus Thiodiazotropha endolucinida]